MNVYSFASPRSIDSASASVAYRRERESEQCSLAHVVLRDELIGALTNDPASIVQTPGFLKPRQSAADVVNDNFSGRAGEASLIELLTIVGQCAAGQIGHELHLRAKAWVARQAAEHAEFHRDDLVDQWGGA